MAASYCQPLPFRLSGSLITRLSPAGGLGNSLLVFRGGLVLDGVIVPCEERARFSLPSPSTMLKFVLVCGCCNDSLRGFVLAGMLDMRKGIDGATASRLLDAR